MDSALPKTSVIVSMHIFCGKAESTTRLTPRNCLARVALFARGSVKLLAVSSHLSSRMELFSWFCSRQRISHSAITDRCNRMQSIFIRLASSYHIRIIISAFAKNTLASSVCRRINLPLSVDNQPQLPKSARNRLAINRLFPRSEKLRAATLEPSASPAQSRDTPYITQQDIPRIWNSHSCEFNTISRYHLVEPWDLFR